MPTMSPNDDQWAVNMGEVVRSLARIEESQKSLTDKVDGLAAGFLPRPEWQLWTKAIETRMASLEAARAPWWTWATILIAALSLLLVLIPRLVS